MKIRNNSSHSFPIDEISFFLNSPTIKKLEKDIHEKFGIYLIATDREGTIIKSFSEFGGDPYLSLVKNVISETDIQFLRKNSEKYVCPGVKLLFFPITYKRQIKGLIIAGPVLEKNPFSKTIRTLSRKYSINPDEIDSFLKNLPVLQDDTRKIAESFLENTIELLKEKIVEKMDHNKRIQDISSVYKVVKSLNTTLSLDEVLSNVLDYSIEILEVKNGTVMLFDDEEQVLKKIVSKGFNGKITLQEVTPLGQGVAGKVAQTGNPIIIYKGERSEDIRGGIPQEVSAICVPLKVMDKIIGVIYCIGKKNNRDFTPAELEILDVIASSAAVAINNAKLYGDLCKKVQEHATLLYVANAISSSLNPDKVLQEVLDKAIRLLDAQKGSLMLIDDETQELRIVNACGLSDEIISHTSLKLGEGISGRVASEGEPILIQKGVKVAESHTDKNAKELDSAISVPVRIKEKVIGVLNIRDHIAGANFKQEHVALLQMLASQAAIAIENAKLHKELKELFVGSVKALINAIEARDKYTKGHSIRVTHYSLRIAKALNMGAEELENLQYAALLHDIGKINIKDEILLKPGKLTVEERKKIQEHPSLGATIMQPVKAFQRILPFLYCHHERFDGKGYSQHLSGEDIPIESRIIAVADSFDAMTSDRPYRKALSINEATKELKENSGTQFDPQIVDIFIDLIQNDKTCSPQYIADTPIV